MKDLEWKVNTGNLLKEISSEKSLSVLSAPIRIFADLLIQVGERASELNDPKLNELMCRLAIYEIADPCSDSYDEQKTKQIIEQGEKK